jgi:hypothetical protein
MRILISLAIICLCRIPLGAGEWEIMPEMGRLIIVPCKNAAFPHALRRSGYVYNDSLYTFEEHYNDSGIAIFVPEDYRAEKKVDLVFYFHGWGNSVRSSIAAFDLIGQFLAANKNAILIIPETVRNAPDSFGGKLEEKDVFADLVEEVLAYLHQEGISVSHRPGKIILSGHSGAYRVIAAILNRGGLRENISEVYLFDALYGQTENYAHWIEKYPGRFINIITPEGETLEESRNLLQDLEDWEIEAYQMDGNQFDANAMRKRRIIFLFTSLGHTDVLNPFFGQCIKSSALFDRY